MKPKPLLERIEELRAEAERLIDNFVARQAKTCPGVPAEVLRMLITARAPGCECRQVIELENQK